MIAKNDWQILPLAFTFSLVRKDDVFVRVDVVFQLDGYKGCRALMTFFLLLLLLLLFPLLPSNKQRQ